MKQFRRARAHRLHTGPSKDPAPKLISARGGAAPACVRRWIKALRRFEVAGREVAAG